MNTMGGKLEPYDDLAKNIWESFFLLINFSLKNSVFTTMSLYM